MSEPPEPPAPPKSPELLDATGLVCPLPVLKARKRLLAMAPGAVLRVRTTDPMAAIDMPHFCSQSGHELLQTARLGDAQEFLIRCRAAGLPADDSA